MKINSALIKSFVPLSLKLLTSAGIIIFFGGCLKDNCSHTYTIYTPVYQTLTSVRHNMKSNSAEEIKNPGKIYVLGNYIFLNELDKGIHVIDNRNPASPKNISFINIPGNVDMAVTGNTLYADSYSDLVTFDISDPLHVVTKKFLNNVFPQRNNFYTGISTNPDSVQVVVAFLSKDTTMDCESFRNWGGCPFCLYAMDMTGNNIYYKSAAPAPGGKGGSMARFALINNNLFTVTTTDLNVFNISNQQDPVFTNKTKIADWSIETIFPFKDRLFIGSNGGMFIYDVSNPANPAKLGQFSHVRTCDPVIADNDYAYVTLSSGNGCAGFTNQLEVLDITNLLNPLLVKTYLLTNPRGLSKDENLLFVCDGKDGVKVYDASNVNNLNMLHQITGIETYDVITWNKIALVVATDGLYQYDYSDIKNIKFLSKIRL